MITPDPRPANGTPMPMATTPAGPGPLNGQVERAIQTGIAVEGNTSPQAMHDSSTIGQSPAGEQTAQPAKVAAAPRRDSLAGHTAGRDQPSSDSHGSAVPAGDFPGGQVTTAAQAAIATGEQAPPAAMLNTFPNHPSPLADPLLALASDVLGDLEKVRIANENRLRQLTRTGEDKDGETRGFGLDESHPDVARLAALVGMLAEAEHKATLNLNRLMRRHPLGPWVKRQKGVGEKQAARLLATIGDPYIRPEIIREDGTVESPRPRRVSELWAFAGYHVIEVPVSGQPSHGTHVAVAADGSGIPASQGYIGPHASSASGEQSGHPGQRWNALQGVTAGVAPKRARGQKTNWSGAAKMRAYLVAESCIKQMDGPYRKVYDSTREKCAEAVHAAECIRCGPKGKPAQPGSPLSDGHKHARALRAVAKEILRDLWLEARRIHEGGEP